MSGDTAVESTEGGPVDPDLTPWRRGESDVGKTEGAPRDFRGLFVFCVAIPFYILGDGAMSALAGNLAGTAVAQMLFLLLLPAAALRLMGFGSTDMFLSLPRRGTAAAACLLAPLAIFFFIQYQMFQETFIYSSEGKLHDLYIELFRLSETPLPLVVLAVAVVPPLCEEFVFRGVLLGSLKKLMGTSAAVLVSAVLFSLLHISIVEVLLPTFILGLLLGAVTVMSRSILPSVAIHLMNNLLVIFLLTRPEFANRAEGWIVFHPLILLASSSAIVLILWAGWTRGREGTQIDPSGNPL
ncbi:MAG: CPBP family glutamic-type intramembrane protease [Planctomycetota bacterium]|jgi:membrane protease YdiL (CAAX protease family)